MIIHVSRLQGCIIKRQWRDVIDKTHLLLLHRQGLKQKGLSLVMKREFVEGMQRWTSSAIKQRYWIHAK